MPVVIVAGQEDRLIDIDKQSARLHEDVTHSTLHRVPGAGHMVHQTATDAVMVAVDEATGARLENSRISAKQPYACFLRSSHSFPEREIRPGFVWLRFVRYPHRAVFVIRGIKAKRFAALRTLQSRSRWKKNGPHSQYALVSSRSYGCTVAGATRRRSMN
jgi:hypothetical protein